jgi:rhodanese-related sulfurtransferase
MPCLRRDIPVHCFSMVPLAIAVLVFGIIAIAWYLYEHRWDRRLFGSRSGLDFVSNVRAKRAVALLHEHALLPVDVRPAPAYLSGHLPGAVNAPFLEGGLDPADLAGIPRDRPILLYCDGGYRSRRALPAIQEAGFRCIYHLHRGILSWKMANQPIETNPSP